MTQTSLDIQWGNHDILWMGAAAGNKACVANTLRIALQYAAVEAIEDGYGINLLPLASFAQLVYKDDACTQFMPKSTNKKSFDIDVRLLAKMHKAISIIQFKIEEQMIDQHPLYNMKHRKILQTFNGKDYTVEIDGKRYPLNDHFFPTVNPENPIELTEQEQHLIDTITNNFVNSEKLKNIHGFYMQKAVCTVNTIIIYCFMPVFY